MTSGREDRAAAEHLPRARVLVGRFLGGHQRTSSRAPACARWARGCRSCRASSRTRTCAARAAPRARELANLRSTSSVSESSHSASTQSIPSAAIFAADVDRAVVHRVAQPRPDVAADDLAAALHHEAGHRGGVAEHDDRAALLVDAGARADVTLDDEVAAAQGRAGKRAGVVIDHDDPRHHVLGDRPPDPSGDLDLGAVDQPTAEVAQAALEADPAAGEDGDAERVPRARVEDGHVGDTLLVDQPAQLGVDLSGRQLSGVEHGAAAVDLRALGDGVVELDEPPLVHPNGGPFAHLLQTRTSPS